MHQLTPGRFATPILPLPAAGRNYQKIQKAICSGFFFHAARKDAQEGYKTGGLQLASLLFTIIVMIGRECCCEPVWWALLGINRAAAAILPCFRARARGICRT